MRKLEHFWTALESVPTLTQPIRLWEETLGPDFDFGLQFLRSTGRLAEWMPCPTPGRLSCGRRVLRDRRGGFIAVCGNEPKECSTFAVERQDLIEHALRVERLASAISKAMGLKGGCERHPHVPEVWGLGRGFDPEHERAEVFLVLTNPSVEVRTIVVDVLSATEGPVIVATPTAHGCDLRTRQLLGREGYGLVVLEELLAADGHAFRMVQPGLRLEVPLSWRPDESVRGNVFRPYGLFWEAVFNGRRVDVPRCGGAVYIWEILKSQPQQLPARELLGRRPDIPNSLHVGSTGDVDEAVDDTAIRHCKSRLKYLRAQLDRTDVQDDAARKTELEREVFDIESYLTATTGLHGRIRLMSNDPRKIANAISAALERAYVLISKSLHRDLERHLRSSIRRRDLEFSYQASPGTDWQTA